jgi:hypothetical protein
MMELLIIVAGASCALTLLARLNYLYWCGRRAMTPEERVKADEEERADMQVW